MSLRTKAIIVLIVVAMLWGTAGTAKILLKSFDPFTVAFFRFFVASLVIVPFFSGSAAGTNTRLSHSSHSRC